MTSLHEVNICPVRMLNTVGGGESTKNEDKNKDFLEKNNSENILPKMCIKRNTKGIFLAKGK